MMSDRTKLKMAQRMQGSSPMDYVHVMLISAPERINSFYKFKGFGGGVPLNTETAAVNPRVGISMR